MFAGVVCTATDEAFPLDRWPVPNIEPLLSTLGPKPLCAQNTYTVFYTGRLFVGVCI